VRQTRIRKHRNRPAAWKQTPQLLDPSDPDIVKAHQLTRNPIPRLTDQRGRREPPSDIARTRRRATTARSPACSGRSATTSGSTSWPACRPRDPTRHTRLGEARMHVISCQPLAKRFVVRVTATIAAAPDQVWQVLTDLHRYRQWHPTLELLDGPPGGQLATGTTTSAARRYRSKER
jgi:Polyketide cyclase / dehydrase and lipid transport